jgi:hypothetical protein
MSPELKLILELLKDKPNKNTCGKLFEKTRKENFLYLIEEFPLDKIIRNLKLMKIQYYIYELNSLFLKNYIKNQILTEELLNFAKKCNTPFILIKSFSRLELIPNRRTSDIDILIDISDIDKIDEVFRKIGYKLKTENLGRDFFLKHMHHLTYHNKKNKNIKFEIHFLWIDKYAPIDYDTKRLFHYAEKKIIGNQEIKIINKEHLIIQLSVHCFYPITITPYRDIYFLHLLIENNKIDWNFLINEAIYFRANNFLYFALKICKETFHTKIPNFVLKKLIKKNLQFYIMKFFLYNKLKLIRRTKKGDLLFTFLLTNSKIDFLKRLFYLKKSELEWRTK